MSLNDLTEAEPPLSMRSTTIAEVEPGLRAPSWLSLRRIVVGTSVTVVVLLVLGVCGYFYARHWVRTATRESLPQLDGSIAVAGLSAPVTVQRDGHGVPHLRAATIDDLVAAQGYVTAQDRLFQMDLLRRHAAGELAEILGPAAIGHDRLQRTLLIRASADRAMAQLPPAQRHMLERFAAGVNGSIGDQMTHLPIEFRVLRYEPKPWTPRDSILVWLTIVQDLSNDFPTKLAREALVARLPADQRAQLEEDLYPVGSWRDYPPNSAMPDLTLEGMPVPDVPLDETQSALRLKDGMQDGDVSADMIVASLDRWIHPAAPTGLMPGSNNWVVSGDHTASGKPLLANDMHLTHSLPGIWYEADLQATEGEFHCAGVSLPGLPLIVVGHNDHVAWGSTNMGADVQDLYLESMRGAGSSEEFQAVDGSWQPVVHLPEPIRVKGGKDLAFEVLATRHGDALTPILNPVLTPDVTAQGRATAGGHARSISLRWTVYDPANIQVPLLEINSAHDWPSFLNAFRTYGGAAQNLVYADDQGHIGFHAIGRIPLRGSGEKQSTDNGILGALAAGPRQQTQPMRANTNPLDGTSVKALAAPQTPLLSGPLHGVPQVPSAAQEWSGYIPFDELPQVFDPPGGVIATANNRTAPDDYAYPLTLNWGAPYRSERIWHLLARRKGLSSGDMLAIQNDVYSDFDRVLAERLTYAIDHAHAKAGRTAVEDKTLHEVADLLRKFDGRMTTDSAAATIVAAVHLHLWPMLLRAKLGSVAGDPRASLDVNAMYRWGERDYALEQVLMHAPPRWLPSSYEGWNELLAAATLTALRQEQAPVDLASWRYGQHHTLDIEHPIFGQSQVLRVLLGVPTGTGPVAQSGDHTTVKQVDRTFGPSERFTADLANPDRSTLNIVEGESGNPMSPWFMDQFPAWYRGTTFPLPYSEAAVAGAATHRLLLMPK